MKNKRICNKTTSPPALLLCKGQCTEHTTVKQLIECFHSRGQHLCKFFGTKDSICIRKEFNSHSTGLGHQHGRRFIVWDTNMARRTSTGSEAFWLLVEFNASKFVCLVPFLLQIRFVQKLGQNHPQGCRNSTSCIIFHISRWWRWTTGFLNRDRTPSTQFILQQTVFT